MTILYGQGIYGQGAYGGGSPPALTIGPNIPPVALYSATWELDPATGDIAIPMRVLRGTDAVSQKLRSRLWFFAGEWFLDRRLGIPYFDQILVKNPKLPVIAALFRRVIQKTRGVASCSNVSVKVDRQTRIGTINFSATLDDGLTLTATDEPLIVGARIPGP